MTEPTVLRRYDSYQGPQVIGNTFTFTKDGRTLRCSLTTHALGWELRLTVGQELMRSQVCKTQDEVLDVGEAWQAEATAKGWV